MSFKLGTIGFIIFIMLNNAAIAKCTCRSATSQNIALGGYTCIKTPEGLRQAKCIFILNNTAWKLTGRQCPSG